MKKRFFTIIFLMMFLLNGFVLKAHANSAPVARPATAQAQRPSITPFESCSKKYLINSEKLFYLLMAAITANNFKIVEIQSGNSSVLFSVSNKEFLASVSKKDSQNSLVIIVPADNNYYFSPIIIQKIFKYIDLNLNSETVKVL